MKLSQWTLMLLPFVATASWGTVGLAQDAVVAPVAPATQTNSETVTQKGGPSRVMLGSGIVTFGLTYGAGVIVAAESSRDADHNMFVPIAGPWMALFDRGDCGGATGRSCDTETAYKVLIVADGVGQALGALMVVQAFLNPEVVTTTRSTTALNRPTFHLAPATLGAGGYGMLAAGTF